MCNENGKFWKHHAIYLITDSRTCTLYTHTQAHYVLLIARSLHGYPHFLCVRFHLFDRVFALTRLMLPLCSIASLVMHISAHSYPRSLTRIRTQTNVKCTETQNSIRFHIRCGVLTCSPNFLLISHLPSSYAHIYKILHIKYLYMCHVYVLNIKFQFFLILIFFFVFLLFAHFRKIFNYKATIAIIYRIQLHSSKQVQT